MKVEFNAPNGDYYKDCPHQEDFSISEIERPTLGDKYPHYIREIVATCHLFKESINGITIGEMNKCHSCAKHTD